MNKSQLRAIIREEYHELIDALNGKRNAGRAFKYSDTTQLYRVTKPKPHDGAWHPDVEINNIGLQVQLES
jgi:hypothetical protein